MRIASLADFWQMTISFTMSWQNIYQKTFRLKKWNHNVETLDQNGEWRWLRSPNSWSGILHLWYMEISKNNLKIHWTDRNINIICKNNHSLDRRILRKNSHSMDRSIILRTVIQRIETFSIRTIIQQIEEQWFNGYNHSA